MDVNQGEAPLRVKKASNRICLLDMDGTIADYTGQIERDLKKLASPDEPTYKLGWGDTFPAHIWNRVNLIKNSKDWWLNLPKLEDGFDLVDLALLIGFEIHVLTKGPKATTTAWTQKVEWCANNLPTYTNVTITQDKSLVYGRILIDDYPDYVLPWLENRPRSLAILPLREWNKDFRHPNAIHYDCNDPLSIVSIKRVMEEQFNR